MNQTIGRRLAIQGTKALVALALAATMGCNHTPVEGLEKSFTLKVKQDSGTGDPIKIDFLWVIDNSTSMCEEQLSLTRSFAQFTNRLSTFFQIDPRVAVTSHDVQCNVNGDTIHSAKGVFNTMPARAFPPSCFEHRFQECRSDDDCANMDCVVSGECDPNDLNCTCAASTAGKWTCHTTSDLCVTNPNGTTNTYCVRRCETDLECQELFGDPSYTCQDTSGQIGCIRQPQTGDCPATIPPVLDSSNIDIFPCLAAIGVNQQNCYRYEQGLNAAWMALDRSGVNADQAKNFLRDDAYLVIIFVSDEDDCSVAEGRTFSLEEYRDTCAFLPTTEVGGPLTPIGHFVNRFKSLKQDPGKVIVAAIAGDSLKGTTAEIAADRDLYIESKSNPRTCYHQSYICLSDNGKADYGARYLTLAESFGPNGIFTNICDDEGVGPALDAIADTIIRVLNRLCLPKPILTNLIVKRTNADGSVDVLTEGDGHNTYTIIPSDEACTSDGHLLPAIAFGDPPSPGEEITVTYQGDPQLN